MYAVFLCVWREYEKRRVRQITPRLLDVEEARRIRDELLLDGDLYAVYAQSGTQWLEVK